MDNTDRKLFILDTNVLLHEPLAIYSFKEHDVLIPMTVLEELDNIKDRQKDVSRDARIAIRALEDVFRDATPEQIVQGVALAGEASGHISIFSDHHLPQDAEVSVWQAVIVGRLLHLDQGELPILQEDKVAQGRLEAAGAHVRWAVPGHVGRLGQHLQALLDQVLRLFASVC
jgi:PhoH-like ATPase